jgi:hypothetical protein
VAVVVNIPKVVDDDIACTDDSCNSNGDVVHAPIDSACGDYTSCTTDSCSAATGCVNTFTDGCEPCHGVGDCDNANACDGQEACDGGGACASGTPPILDDGNVCTADSCIPDTGPVHTSLGGSPCGPTTNVCDANYMVCSDTTCTAAGQSCDDSNPFTVDSCNQVDATCAYHICPLYTCAYVAQLVLAADPRRFGCVSLIPTSCTDGGIGVTHTQVACNTGGSLVFAVIDTTGTPDLNCVGTCRYTDGRNVSGSCR